MIDRDVASESVTEITTDAATNTPGTVELSVVRREAVIHFNRRILIPVISTVDAGVPACRRSRHRRHRGRILEATAVEIRCRRTQSTAENESRAEKQDFARIEHVTFPFD